MKTSKLLLLLAVLCVFISKACREKVPCQDPRNKECENYDPCIDAKETSAEFTIEEKLDLSMYSLKYETDTVSSRSSVILSLKQPYDSVLWLFDGREFRISYRNKSQISITYEDPNKMDEFWRSTITCIVYNKGLSNCFPADNGVDTLTKIITVAPIYKSIFYGKYRGALSHKPDSVFDISIDLINVRRSFSTQYPYDVNMNIYGLGKCEYGRDSIYSTFNTHSTNGLGYRGFIVNFGGVNSPFCGPRYGDCYYDNSVNKLIINYVLHPKLDKWYKFEGKKID